MGGARVASCPTRVSAGAMRVALLSVSAFGLCAGLCAGCTSSSASSDSDKSWLRDAVGGLRNRAAAAGAQRRSEEEELAYQAYLLVHLHASPLDQVLPTQAFTKKLMTLSPRILKDAPIAMKLAVSYARLTGAVASDKLLLERYPLGSASTSEALDVTAVDSGTAADLGRLIRERAASAELIDTTQLPYRLQAARGQLSSSQRATRQAAQQQIYELVGPPSDRAYLALLDTLHRLWVTTPSASPQRFGRPDAPKLKAESVEALCKVLLAWMLERWQPSDYSNVARWHHLVQMSSGEAELLEELALIQRIRDVNFRANPSLRAPDKRRR